jgi:hypothetical protein
MKPHISVDVLSAARLKHIEKQILLKALGVISVKGIWAVEVIESGKLVKNLAL